MPAVSIVVPGTPFGTSCRNPMGNAYILQNVFRRMLELVVSYIGFETQRFKISGREEINVALKMSVSGLRRDGGDRLRHHYKGEEHGQHQLYSADEIAKQPVANPLNALQGRVAGALVTQSNGLPGFGVTIVVRGLNTLDATGAGSQPLYIRRGALQYTRWHRPRFQRPQRAADPFAANGGISPFSIINPSEIERIDILKDARRHRHLRYTRGQRRSAYHHQKRTRLVKTKAGHQRIRSGARKSRPFLSPMMNTEQYLQMRKEAYANDGITPTTANAPDLPLLWDQYRNTDWQKNTRRHRQHYRRPGHRIRRRPA